MAVETVVNVLLALVPRAVMAVMHTTMIRASMTAYSTAVGPSSRFRKLTTRSANLRIARSFQKKKPVSRKTRGLLVWPLCSLRACRTVRPAPKEEPNGMGRLAGGADGRADGGERLLGAGAQGRDGGDAHHDDQR